MQLSEKFFTFLPPNLSYQSKKFFTVFSDDTGKKAYLSGKRLQLFSHNSSFGEKFVEITEEQAKQKHLGKVRCLGVVSDEYEALVVFSKYFSFEKPAIYLCPKVEHEKKQKYVVKKVKRLELKTNQLPSDRDEKELILKYRSTTDIKEKNRIFRVILYFPEIKFSIYFTSYRNKYLIEF